MTLNRWSCIAVAATFLIADVGLAAAAQAVPDPTYPTYPTGTFTITLPTEYIYDPDGWDPERAFVEVTRSSLSDDSTPADDIVVKLYSGSAVANSTNGAEWTEGTSEQLLYGGAMNDDLFPVYHLAGTYHPYVTLTDSDGHTTTIALPTVTLLEDHTAPVSTLTLPKPRQRHQVSGWRRVNGTALDAGVSRPAAHTWPSTDYAVLQKRHGFYYYFDADKGRFRKGRRTIATTFSTYDVTNQVHWVTRRVWRSKPLNGLTKGRIWVYSWSVDANLNEAEQQFATSLLTRR